MNCPFRNSSESGCELVQDPLDSDRLMTPGVCEFCDFENCPLYRDRMGAELRADRPEVVIMPVSISLR